MPPRLSEDQKQLLTFFPDDGSAIGGYSLIARLQEAGWRTREIELVMGELSQLGEIIVGRGGSGGSIRHVRNDRKALLEAIDEFEAQERPCTRATLQEFMEWHPDYLEQVLDALRERGQIEVSPGRRGAITRAHASEDGDDHPPPEHAPVLGDPSEDERHLLELVPETGAIGNTRLRNQLTARYGWDEERYWETRKRLRQRGVVELGRGRGGALRRARMDAAALTNDPPAEPEPRPPAEQRDEEMLWVRLPENGDELDLATLQAQLEWNATRFYAALEQMVADQKIYWHNSKVKRLLPAPAPPESSLQSPIAVEPRPSIQSRETLLYWFVRDHFQASSLRRFLELRLEANEVVEGTPWDTDYYDITGNVVAELRRRNYIDAEFFQHLRADFRRLHSEIDALERRWQTSENRG